MLALEAPGPRPHGNSGDNSKDDPRPGRYTHGMYKALAVLRTLYLLFIVGYTVRAMPIFTSVSNTFDEQYARCSSSLNLVLRAAWFAIAWIAFETAVGWFLATRARPTPTAPVPPQRETTRTSSP